MAEAGKSGELAEKFRWGAMGLGLKTLAGVLMRTGRKDEWMGRALDDFRGVYRFENRDGTFCRYLVFRGGGKVVVTKKYGLDPDFTLSLRDPKAFGLKSRPENVLEVVIANKIGQSGNMYYLYQFGFIMSLLERYYRSKRKKKLAT